MIQIEARAVEMRARAVGRVDGLIRQTARTMWQRLRPASCSPEDIAQEIRVALLEKQMSVQTARRPVTFLGACIRHEALRALKQLARDEVNLGSALGHSEDMPWVQELLYSSADESAEEVPY